MMSSFKATCSTGALDTWYRAKNWSFRARKLGCYPNCNLTVG
jgi:hypothetical protein